MNSGPCSEKECLLCVFPGEAFPDSSGAFGLGHQGLSAVKNLPSFDENMSEESPGSDSAPSIFFSFLVNVQQENYFKLAVKTLATSALVLLPCDKQRPLLVDLQTAHPCSFQR